jgi:hypothetical protein
MMPAACSSSIATAIELSMRALPVLPPIRRSAKCAAERFAGGQEPTLDELLSDPILGRLIASDGVVMDDLLALVGDVRKALARR